MAPPAKSKTTRSQLFRALGDESRLRILECLFVRPLNVSDLSVKLTIEQSLLSHHLSALRKSKLVLSFRKGKEVYYQISDEIRSKSNEHEMELPCCNIVFTDQTARGSKLGSRSPSLQIKPELA